MKNITKASRWIIYLSLFVSGSVILTAVLRFSNNNNKDSKIQPGILIGIIVLALLAAGIVIFLRTSKNNNLSKLDKEYYNTYEHIADMLQGSTMSITERKEILSDILVFFLQAQQDNRMVFDVTGDDIESFVEQIQNSYGYRNKILFHFLNGIQYSIFYIFLLYGYSWLKSYQTLSFYDIRLDLPIMTFLLPVAFFVIPLMRYFIRKEKIIYAVITPVGIFAVIVLLNELVYKFRYDIKALQVFFDGQICLIPSFLALSGWIILAVAAQIIKWYQRRISIKKL